MNPLVELSVVIPVYNGEDFIESTIQSVLSNSNGFSVECIVIDDGSTDGTSDIINTFKGQIRVFRQNNSGEGAAVNKGIELARGKYIVIISADDPVFTPKLFEGVASFFESESRAVAWYPDWHIIDFQGRITKTIELPPYDFGDLFSKNKVLPGPGTWFRASAATAIGGRKTHWRYVGDYDFWLRLSRQGSLVHRSEVLAQWRMHSRSTSIAKRGLRMSQERISVIEEFIKDNGGNLTPESISLARAHARYLSAKLGFFSRSVNSRKLFLESVKIDFRVLASAKPHEILFMLIFPISKYFIDFLLKVRKPYG